MGLHGIGMETYLRWAAKELSTLKGMHGILAVQTVQLFGHMLHLAAVVPLTVFSFCAENCFYS